MTMAISEDSGNNNNPSSKKDIERPGGHLGNLMNNGVPGSRGGGGPNMDMMDHQSCGGYQGRAPSSGPPPSGNKWTPQMHGGGSWDDPHASVMEPTYAPLVKVCVNFLYNKINES